MKKFISLVCIFCSLTLLFSCSASKRSDNNENIDVERASIVADSVDELLDTIKLIKQGKKEDFHNNAASLDSLIVPDFTIEGYYLAMIELTDKRIFYYFSPLAVDKKEFSVSNNRDYVVTVCRSEYVNKNNPLQPLMDQLKRQPDENGYLRGDFNEVIFVYDSVWVSIRPPRGLKEFGDLTKLCKMKTIKIA